MAEQADAVIVGGGHNGLVAANLLADRGWDVLVLEAAAEPGGAVRGGEVTAPGFHSDLFSAFYPMTAASPVMAALQLDRHGLEWTHAPHVVAHVRGGRPATILDRDPASTAAGLDRAAPGDGEAWLQLQDMWDRLGPSLMRCLLGPMPPLRAATGLAVRARKELLDIARMAILPVRRLADERFSGAGPALLLTGNALHADVTPEGAPSALLGWMLVGLAQSVGFPVPVGGSQRITEALAARLAAAGGRIRCGAPAERIDVDGGRAVAVHAGGERIAARRAVIAACDAQVLYDRLVGAECLPADYAAGLRRFERAAGTVKINFALDRPVPWSDPAVRGSGTVHVADSLDELTMTAAQLSAGRLPDHPFLLVGQMTTADATRSPAGTESLWAYTHVPQDIEADAAGEIDASGQLRGDALVRFADRMQARIEANAPGFGASVVARHVQGPADLEAENPSLVGGDISGGTSQLHQQLIFRPVPGFGRPETPISGLFLGSASAHPGGSVHGACGANAARAAILHDRVNRLRTMARRTGR